MKPFSWMWQWSHPPFPQVLSSDGSRACIFLTYSQLCSGGNWAFYSHWVGPPFPICSHLCLPFLSALVSFLHFRAADWHYGCITITPYLKCLEPRVLQIWEFCIFWIISTHNAVLHLGVFITFVTAVTRYTTGSNLARFIFFLFVSYFLGRKNPRWHKRMVAGV